MTMRVAFLANRRIPNAAGGLRTMAGCAKARRQRVMRPAPPEA
jgi:hypothetical protein